MKISNIETSYGKFKSVIEFEEWWESKVMDAYTEGFYTGFKQRSKLRK